MFGKELELQLATIGQIELWEVFDLCLSDLDGATPSLTRLARENTVSAY